jgi:acetyltransferase-like isoleucine patch superfamily enzyme
METRSVKTMNLAVGLRGFLFLEGFVRLFLWYSSFAFTMAIFGALRDWPGQPLIGGSLGDAWKWGEALSQLVLIYNVVYLTELLVLRLPIPSPKEGEYDLSPGRPFDVRLVWTALISIIVRARYQAPFPAFLVFHLSNIPPFCWLVTWIIGPKSKSCLLLDPPVPDPDLTEIGRNVIVGNMTSIIAHNQYRDHVSLRKTVIEDDAMIGAHALVYGGCTIKRGAVVYGGAVVPPNTVIGENEAWGGVPARKIKDLPAAGDEVGRMRDEG